MSCTINNAPAVCPQYQSPSLQNQLLVILLNAAQENVAFSDLLEEAEAEGLTCLSTAQNRAKQATMICEGLESFACDQLACYTPVQLEAIKSVLICSLVDSVGLT
jgi:hypothetical protein